MIAGYNGLPIPLRNPVLLLVNRLKLQGFIVSEHPDSWPPALKALSAGVRSGQLKYRESIADGLPSAPQAFIGMLDGKNVGKQLVKLI
jgi:NADPH-dependent curcumin reductase CurA